MPVIEGIAPPGKRQYAPIRVEAEIERAMGGMPSPDALMGRLYQTTPPPPKPAPIPLKGGPTSEIVKKLEAEAEAKRGMTPPDEMLRRQVRP